MAANPGTIFTFSSSTPQNPEQRLLQLESFCRQAQATIEQLQKENLYLKQVLVRDEKAKLEAPAKCGGDRDKLSGFFCNCVPISPTTPNVSQLREISSDFTRKICDSFQVFADELGKVFGDPNAQQHAQDRLTRLEQTKSAAAYAAQFRQYSLRSGINDEGLLQLFYQSLKKDVKDRLCAEDRSTTLDEYTTMTIRIDIRLHERRQQRARDRPTQRQVYTKRETRSVVPGTHPEPMDIGVMRRSYKNITCYNCGQQGHIKRNCKVPRKTWKPVPLNKNAVVDKGRANDVAAAEHHDHQGNVF
ncbi:uncharacterized protein CTHT_0071670 [Thermochaetoides thermophila DSM 1495]|uniref:CCHC-type domain-containing protein n=1 Tax=Chaetomium thermophilum (strain DSM 1495 / CBS 144.50 / IMI 039719) TaxID=759272 RepID=G0SFP9_CHATD|nr:hypothetical protein CTHT_0071670 [Thermochaetoides thermophila DSM 1495]EGS17814.1 hypothetical protein CTHT_0071670 [Thermochaetoides thermophila DSM 1495]